MAKHPVSTVSINYVWKIVFHVQKPQLNRGAILLLSRTVPLGNLQPKRWDERTAKQKENRIN